MCNRQDPDVYCPQCNRIICLRCAASELSSLPPHIHPHTCRVCRRPYPPPVSLPTHYPFGVTLSVFRFCGLALPFQSPTLTLLLPNCTTTPRNLPWLISSSLVASTTCLPRNPLPPTRWGGLRWLHHSPSPVSPGGLSWLYNFGSTILAVATTTRFTLGSTSTSSTTLARAYLIDLIDL